MGRLELPDEATLVISKDILRFLEISSDFLGQVAAKKASDFGTGIVVTENSDLNGGIYRGRCGEAFGRDLSDELDRPDDGQIDGRTERTVSFGAVMTPNDGNFEGAGLHLGHFRRRGGGGGKTDLQLGTRNKNSSESIDIFFFPG